MPLRLASPAFGTRLRNWQRDATLLPRPHYQQRHCRPVSHFVNRAAAENIANKPMAVRSHGDEIDVARISQFHDFAGRLSESEHRFAGEAFINKFPLSLFQVGSVLPHLFTLRQLKLIVIPRYESIGDVHEQELRASHARERFDVIENGLIGCAVFDGNKNALIHRV